jgi:hypothetical protein
MSDLGTIITDLERQRAAIERALSALREVEGSALPAPVKKRGRPKKVIDAVPPTKKRILSPEGRRRIIEATKRRWAAVRGEETAQQKSVAKRKRPALTPAGRKRLSELMKARWASKNPPKGRAKKQAA